jgi:hypothetical protein
LAGRAEHANLNVPRGSVIMSRSEDAKKLTMLRKLVRVGIDDIEAGRYQEVADSDLDRYLKELMERASAKRHR